jgi:hypothetical protein
MRHSAFTFNAMNPVIINKRLGSVVIEGMPLMNESGTLVASCA